MAKVVAHQFKTEHGIELVLTEPIAPWTAERLITQLSGLKGQHIALSIFSPGGDAFAGFAIYDYITDEKNGLKVEARVYGMAASAAMIIAAGCSPRLIGESSMAMAHEARMAGDEDPDKKEQAVIDSMNERQVEIFSKITGRRKDTIAKLMKEDRFMDADEAVELGFFDGKIAQAKVAALFKSTNMADEKDVKPTTRKLVVGHKALAAAAFTKDGHIEVPVTEFVVSDADKVKELDEQIEALTKERDALKANADKVPTLESQVTALTTERDKFKTESETKDSQLEALKKNPLVAQVLADGKTVVIPGAPADDKGSQPATAGEQRFASAADAYEKFKQQRAAALKA